MAAPGCQPALAHTFCLLYARALHPLAAEAGDAKAAALSGSRVRNASLEEGGAKILPIHLPLRGRCVIQSTLAVENSPALLKSTRSGT